MPDSDEENDEKKSSPFANIFPFGNRRKAKPSTSSSLPSLVTAISHSESSLDGDEKLQNKLDASTKFAFADLLIAILKLDFLREGDKPSLIFCNSALEVILKWATLPEKTNDTLRHHMQDEGCVNDDFVTLIDVIKKDDIFKNGELTALLGSLLITIIEDGTYDSRFRVLLRHTSALLGISWDKFEDLEETLADRLLHDFEESESGKEITGESRRTRERLAKSKRFKRYALIGAAGGVGAVLIGLTGGMAAPFVASGIGAITSSAIFTGLGTTAGAAIFGSVFGVAGGGLAGYRMKKRVGAIEEFVVETLTDSKNSSLHCVLCVSGWIDENDALAFQRPWRHLWMSKEQYTLRYESKYLEEWSKAMDYFVSIVVGYAIQRSLMETILAGVFTAIAWPLVLISSSSIIDNPWNVCFSRTTDVGEHLAEVLLSRSHGRRPITLIGFSLGARVIYHCLLAMSKREGSLGIIEDVILLGAPVSASPSQWQQICSVVGGRVINGFCTTDWLLRFLYRTASVQFTIAGTGPVENKHEKKIVNFNLSHIIKGHTEYLKKLTEVLDAVGVRVTPLSRASRQDLQSYEEKNAVKIDDSARNKSEILDEVLKSKKKNDDLPVKFDLTLDGENSKSDRENSNDEGNGGNVNATENTTQDLVASPKLSPMDEIESDKKDETDDGKDKDENEDESTKED